MNLDECLGIRGYTSPRTFPARDYSSLLVLDPMDGVFVGGGGKMWSWGWIVVLLVFGVFM